MVPLPKLMNVSSKQEAINFIGEQIKRGRQINQTNLEFEIAESRYQAWDRETHDLILELFDTDRYAKEYEVIADGIEPNERCTTWRNDFSERMNTKIRLLEEFQRRIQKHLADPNPPQSETTIDFWLLIHPEIIAVTKRRFDAGEYADSAAAGFKHINSVVKDIVKTSTGNEYDGAALMRQAFTPNKPIITIQTLATESGKNVQQGYMDIFAGSMTGIRNPKAHANISIGRERAIHFIFLASLLMDTIDIARNRYRYATGVTLLAGP